MLQPTGTGDWDNLLPQRIFCSPSVGCRHVRPVRQLGVNLPKTAGQKHKKYPRFQVEIRGISFHLFPQVAGGFAFLPYAATLCGTQRMEIRRFKITFRLLPLDKTIVFHFYDFVLVLSVVFSRCQLYSVSLSQRKLIPNSALFILPFREFYA